jgi:putative oxidoreductase
VDFNALGLLILRVGFGATMAVQHGLPKLLDFSNKMKTFPDPLHLGSGLSLSLALGAELVCAILIIVGIFTRWAAFPLAINMGVAFFLIHGLDPMAKKELALLYFLAFSAIVACGPGAYSADAVFRRVR